jgi:WD40 repeat protein
MRTICLSILIALIFITFVYAQEETLAPELQALDTLNAENVSQLEEIALVDEDTRNVSISLNGAMVAVVTQFQDSDYNIKIFDSESGLEVSAMRGRMDFFRELIWSPDSQRIAVISGRTTGAGVEERSVKVYTIALGIGTYYFGGQSDLWYADYIYPDDPYGFPVDVAWSPASDMIAVAFYQRLVIYDVDPDTELFSTSVIDIQFVEWSSDGRLIITRVNDEVRLWGVPSTDG